MAYNTETDIHGATTDVTWMEQPAEWIDFAAAAARWSHRNLLDNAYWANPDAIIDQLGGYVVPPGTSCWQAGDVYVTTDKYYKVEEITAENTAKITVNGVTSYAPAGAHVRGYTGGGYGIDRWLSYKTDNVVIITEDGLQLIVTDTSSYIEFVQRLPIQPLIGKTVNASFLTASNELATGSTTVSQGMDVNVCFGSKLRLNLYAPTEGVLALRFIGSGETIKAVKLELGDTQTLAHQDENGNWVLNEITDYGEQLARCQRYFYKATLVFGTMLNKIAPNTAQLDIQFPVTMRTSPSLKSARRSIIRLDTNTSAYMDGNMNPLTTTEVLVRISNSMCSVFYDSFTNPTEDFRGYYLSDGNGGSLEYEFSADL